MNCTFDGSRLTTTNSSLKMRFTINRLRLCSKPALQSKSLKRIFCSSLRRKRILVTRSFGLLCSFLVSIHSFGLERRSTRENARPRRASSFRMPKKFSAYKGTARSPQVRRKIRGGKIFEKSMPNLRYGFRGWVVSLCNITTMRAPKQTLGTDWSGLERTSEPRYFTQLYLAA